MINQGNQNSKQREYISLSISRGNNASHMLTYESKPYISDILE